MRVCVCVCGGGGGGGGGSGRFKKKRISCRRITLSTTQISWLQANYNCFHGLAAFWITTLPNTGGKWARVRGCLSDEHSTSDRPRVILTPVDCPVRYWLNGHSAVNALNGGLFIEGNCVSTHLVELILSLSVPDFSPFISPIRVSLLPVGGGG